MNRRDFTGLLTKAAAVAPFIRFDAKPEAPRVRMTRRPQLYGDGIHDDYPAIQYMVNWNEEVVLNNGTYLLSDTVRIPPEYSKFVFSSGSRFSVRDTALDERDKWREFDRDPAFNVNAEPEERNNA